MIGGQMTNKEFLLLMSLSDQDKKVIDLEVIKLKKVLKFLIKWQEKEFSDAER
jgi:hypothetical protein